MKKIILPVLILIGISTGCKKDDAIPTPPEPTYSKVKITKVTVIQFQDTDNSGYAWDDIDDADLYFEITYAGTSNSIFKLDPSLRYYDVTNSDVPLSWSFSPNLLISSLSSPIDVDLWDYDNLNNDDYIGSCSYNFSNYTTGSNKYPPSITTQTGDNIIKLDLVWTN